MEEKGKNKEEVFSFFPKGLEGCNPISIKSLALAFIGDSVFETYMRGVALEKCVHRVKDLHEFASSHSKATSQAKAMRLILKSDILSEDEIAVFKRGRNQSAHAAPKSASAVDYRVATGFEALIGHLYISKEFDRMVEIMALAVELLEEK